MFRPAQPSRCAPERSRRGPARRLSNYNDYPRSGRARLTLQTHRRRRATQSSGQRGELDQPSLPAYRSFDRHQLDVGFPSFFGSVPNDPTATGQAAAVIGQGKVEVSPTAMADVAASVAAGETVIPHLVDGRQATSKGQPLTAQEARQLRQMMRL